MLRNLQDFAKFQKFQLDNLVDFEKCCKTHIFLQKSVPIQPKTSNILPKFCQKLATTVRAAIGLRRRRAHLTGGARAARLGLRERPAGCVRIVRQTLEGSFSAVSKRNFASKYAFESSRRDLHNALLCTAPKSHFFQKNSRISEFAKICENFQKFCEIRNFSNRFFAKKLRLQRCKRMQIL